MNGFKWYILTIFCFSTALVAQSSLWKDHNPYAEPLKEGDLVEVRIKDNFTVDIDSKWQNDNKIEFKLNPDKSLEFLKAADQNKTHSNNSNVIFDIDETLDLKVMAEVKKTEDNGRTFLIEGRKVITIDQKTSAMVLSGKISPGSVKGGMIDSTMIADLNLSIQARNPFPRDNNYRQPARNDNQPPEQVITNEEKRKLIEKHFQEILGYFK